MFLLFVCSMRCTAVFVGGDPVGVGVGPVVVMFSMGDADSG